MHKSNKLQKFIMILDSTLIYFPQIHIYWILFLMEINEAQLHISLRYDLARALTPWGKMEQLLPNLN